MGRQTPIASAARLAVAAVAIASLAGCAQVKDWFQQDRSRTSANGVILGAPDPEYYIDEMYRVASGDAAEQAAVYAAADTAAQQAPGPSTRLRLALILSVPEHAHTDLERAQGIFSDLLSQQEVLTPTEVALVTVHARDVEQRIFLARETQRLQNEAERLQSAERRTADRRLQRVEQENRDLREALTEAEEKLEAITTIERSIREHADGSGDQ